MAREIAFIDPGIPELDVFIAGLRPGLPAIVLSPDRAAPEQIAEALRQWAGLNAVHIVAHGAPGSIKFMSGALSRETIQDHALDLAEIGHALGPGGHLMLWACEVGRSDGGTAFLEALEEATGVRVAAARGRVGSTERGGHWSLDCIPIVDAEPPLAPEARHTYPGLLEFFDLNVPSM